MLAAAYGTVSDIEVVWTLIAFLGFGFGAFNLKHAYRELQWAKALPARNGRWVVAKYALRQELARMLIQGIFITIGVLAMLLPEPPDYLKLPPLQLAIGVAIRWGLIVCASLIFAKSIDSFFTRRKLLGG